MGVVVRDVGRHIEIVAFLLPSHAALAMQLSYQCFIIVTFRVCVRVHANGCACKLTAEQAATHVRLPPCTNVCMLACCGLPCLYVDSRFVTFVCALSNVCTCTEVLARACLR